MDENAKKIQREIAKDKVQVILASIALSVLVVMEFYVMINYKSNFIAMAAGILTVKSRETISPDLSFENLKKIVIEENAKI